MYAEKLRANKVPHTLHIYPNGGHGWGFMEGPGRLETWRAEFYNSLQNWLNYINK
jgi:acetyl esterase/lipase